MARNKAVAPPPAQSKLGYERKEGVHYTEGQELPEEITMGDGPIDRKLEEGYEIVYRKGRKVVLACPESQYQAKRAAAMRESHDRLQPRREFDEERIAEKDDPISVSLSETQNVRETLGEMISALPETSEDIKVPATDDSPFE